MIRLTETTAFVTVIRDGIRDQRVVTLPQRRERGTHLTPEAETQAPDVCGSASVLSQGRVSASGLLAERGAK